MTWQDGHSMQDFIDGINIGALRSAPIFLLYQVHVRRDHLRVVIMVVDTAAAVSFAVGGTACYAGSGIDVWRMIFRF